ncbi:hypothetical protein ACFLTZ_00720 [Chloroflexota bacterium]
MSIKGYKILLPILLLSLMLCLVPGCAQTPAAPIEEEVAKVAPTVTIKPAVVAANSKTQMVIMGSNFEPGQEISIIVKAQGQTLSGIVSMCEPEPIPDETGAWITVWTFGRYARALGKVAPNGGEGAYTLKVTDADFNLLASAPFAIAVTAKKSYEDWSDWAKVFIAEPKE